MAQAGWKADLPPEHGADQNRRAIGHSPQAQRCPERRFGAEFVHHVPVNVGFAYPDEGKDNDDIAPDGDQQTGDRGLKIGCTEEGGYDHEPEEAQSPGEKEVFYLSDQEDEEHGAGKLQQPADAFKFSHVHTQ